VLILAGVLLYVLVIVALLRIFHGIRRGDKEMRLITAEWIDETSGIEPQH
jgi:hypothetical protein